MQPGKENEENKNDVINRKKEVCLITLCYSKNLFLTRPSAS